MASPCPEHGFRCLPALGSQVGIFLRGALLSPLPQRLFPCLRHLVPLCGRHLFLWGWGAGPQPATGLLSNCQLCAAMAGELRRGRGRVLGTGRGS